MKVLLIHQAFATPKDGGGTRHYEFATRFVANGNSFVVVTSDRSYLTGDKLEPSIQSADGYNNGGLTIIHAYTHHALHQGRVGRVISLRSFMVSSFFEALRRQDIDMVMGTSPPIFQAVSAWLVAALKRKPFLLEIRDLWPEFLVDMGLLKNRALIKIFKRLELFLYKRADHIMVNSPAYKNYLIGQGVPETKITLVSNGVDPDMFDPNVDGRHFRENHGLNDSFLVTYAGALGKANDIDTIFRASQRLINHRDIRFLLIGNGIEKKRLETLISKDGIQNVLFLGVLSKSEVASALAASDVCVATLKNIPMFTTTYPNKVFDYMAARKPTVLAIDGVIREVIQNAGGGISVTPGNDEELAAAIMKLHDDPALGYRMGKAAREYVVKNFNRNDQSRLFEATLKRVAAVQ
ncbi:MAG: glycosyltransferase family 4 protein [Desulfomonilaceae bacterium]